MLAIFAYLKTGITGSFKVSNLIVIKANQIKIVDSNHIKLGAKFAQVSKA